MWLEFKNRTEQHVALPLAGAGRGPDSAIQNAIRVGA